jgi:hypothetical protein
MHGESQVQIFRKIHPMEAKIQQRRHTDFRVMCPQILAEGKQILNVCSACVVKARYKISRKIHPVEADIQPNKQLLCN